MNAFLLIRGVSALALACAVTGCALTADAPMSGDDMGMASGGKGGSGGSGNGGSGGSGPGGSGGSGGGAPVDDMAMGPTGTLPFAVDSAFITSGYMGDGITAGVIKMTPSTPGDSTTCNGDRASASAIGTCHIVVYTPPKTNPTGAGVYWQFPANNWGAKPGYLMPLGATKVTFYAKGAKGGEVVKFFAGGETGQANQDTVNANVAPTLSSTWTQYTIDLAGQSYTQVLGGFGWWMDAAAAGTSGSFFIDDIQWE